MCTGAGEVEGGVPFMVGGTGRRVVEGVGGRWDVGGDGEGGEGGAVLGIVGDWWGGGREEWRGRRLGKKRGWRGWREWV